MLETLSAHVITGTARALTGARALWLGVQPEARQRIYYANHSSHFDFVLLWSSLPPALRRQTRPVAGADYWLGDPLRRYLIQKVFHGVLVDRARQDPDANPLAPLIGALGLGDSLILFPEGTRNTQDGLLPFKSGIYRLSQAFPEVEIVPVWMSNLNRVMPKGKLIPLPLLCTLHFGAPLTIVPGQDKNAFLEQARDALLALAPEHDPS